MEQKWIVEGAGVDREAVRLFEFSAEYQSAANGTAVAHRIAAIAGLRSVFEDLTVEAHVAACDSHERNETRAGCFATVNAIAVARIDRFPGNLITQCAAKTSAVVAFHR